MLPQQHWSSEPTFAVSGGVLRGANLPLRGWNSHTSATEDCAYHVGEIGLSPATSDSRVSGGTPAAYSQHAQRCGLIIMPSYSRLLRQARSILLHVRMQCSGRHAHALPSSTARTADSCFVLDCSLRLVPCPSSDPKSVSGEAHSVQAGRVDHPDMTALTCKNTIF